MTSKYDTVLFDLDGTLVDSRADLAASVNHALKTAGQPLQSEEQIIPHVGNGLRKLLANVFGPVDDSLLEIGIAAFSEHYSDHCVDKTVLYEDVATALKDLAKNDVKLAVVTNKPWAFAEKILHALDVSPLFSAVIGGDSTPEKKPHPAPILAALKKLECDAKNALILGDGIQDIKAGQAANLKTCAALYGYGFNKETLALRPDFSINRFKEIKEIVL
jgi:phosphoglycolate phosphatase